MEGARWRWNNGSFLIYFEVNERQLTTNLYIRIHTCVSHVGQTRRKCGQASGMGEDGSWPRGRRHPVTPTTFSPACKAGSPGKREKATRAHSPGGRVRSNR